MVDLLSRDDDYSPFEWGDPRSVCDSVMTIDIAVTGNAVSPDRVRRRQSTEIIARGEEAAKNSHRAISEPVLCARMVEFHRLWTDGTDGRLNRSEKGVVG